MTEGDAGTAFVGQETKNIFVTLDVAAALTNYSPAYIERLCRDGYIPCASGKGGEILPMISELVKLLNITLAKDAAITYVMPEDILSPSLSREQLLVQSKVTPKNVVGNQPVGMNVGGVTEPAPLMRGALSFSLISDEEEQQHKVVVVPPPTGVVSAPPPTPPPPSPVQLEVPPPPSPKSLPSHWPVKTNADVSAHFDDAPLMPPLAAKPMLPPSLELTKPAPVSIVQESDKLPRGVMSLLPEVSPHEELAIPEVHTLGAAQQEAVLVPPEEHLATPPEQELLVHPEEHLAMPREQSLLVEEEPQISAGEAQQRALPSEPTLSTSASGDVLLTPDQNLVQSAAQAIDVAPLDLAHASEEYPAVVMPPDESMTVEMVASPLVEAHESTAQVEEENTAAEEEAAVSMPIPQVDATLEPPKVIIDPTPPPVDAGIADRILEEAARSKVTPQTIDEVTEIEPEEQVPAEPIVAVPHYAVAQLTPSMHPLALPPRVVPFATMVPAAYPQVAAVFTQPHARASEWLPWMRTSHFSRSEVRTATNPEVHPSYPRYSNAPVLPADQRERAGSAQVASPAPQVQAAKVFVSVVGKPVLPTQIPVVAHIAPPPDIVPVPAPSREVPKAEDAWDEMLASQAARNNAVTPPFEEIPQKSREELLKEVSADIKDSWDASFLAGLGAA